MRSITSFVLDGSHLALASFPLSACFRIHITTASQTASRTPPTSTNPAHFSSANKHLSDCDEPLWVYLVWLPLACEFALLIIQLPSCIRTWHHRTAEWVPLQALGDGNLCTNRKRSLISPAAILYMKQHGQQKVAFIKASTLSVQLSKDSTGECSLRKGTWVEVAVVLLSNRTQGVLWASKWTLHRFPVRTSRTNLFTQCLNRTNEFSKLMNPKI